MVVVELGIDVVVVELGIDVVVVELGIDASLKRTTHQSCQLSWFHCVTHAFACLHTHTRTHAHTHIRLPGVPKGGCSTFYHPLGCPHVIGQHHVIVS